MPAAFQQSNILTLGILAVLFCVTTVLGLMINKFDLVIAFGLVGGIIVFILSFVNVQFAVYILIFATLLSPEFGSRTTSGSGVTIRVDDLILIVICFAQLTKSGIYSSVGLFSWTPLNRYIGLYMLICVISTTTGVLFGRVNPLTGFFFVAKYFQYFVIYFMVINNLETKSQARGYLISILITAAIVSLVAMSQIPGGGRVSAPFEGESGEPNTLGGYLLLITSITGGLLLAPGAVPKFGHRFLLYTLCFMMVIPILFTLSRATWLAAVPMCIAFWVLSDKKVILTGGAIAILAMSPFLMPESVKERLFYTTEKQDNVWALKQQESVGGVTFDTSSSARIRSWKNSLEAIPTHPIIGWGVTGWRFIDAQYFKVVVETGLLGLASFWLLLGKILSNTWQSYKKGEDPLFRGVSLGFIVGTIAMISHATMTNTFIIVRIMEPFCLIMAIVIGVPHLEEQEREAQEAAKASEAAREQGEPTPAEKRLLVRPGARAM